MALFSIDLGRGTRRFQRFAGAAGAQPSGEPSRPRGVFDHQGLSFLIYIADGVSLGFNGGGASRENAAPVSFHNALVHVRREAEIVGVHHKLFAQSQNSFN